MKVNFKKRKVLNLGTKDQEAKIIEEEIKEDNTNDNQAKFLSLLSISTNLGFAVSIPIVAGAMIGVYIDKILETSPKMTLSLIFVGTFLSFSYIYKIVKENKKDKQK